MKPVSDQNDYEVLEVPYSATWGDIQRAYQLAKKTYTGDAMAANPLFGPEERALIFKRVEAAYQTLGHADKRKAYDDALAQATPGLFPSKVPSPPPADTDAAAPIQEVTGEVLKKLREARGLSLQEIAHKTRINSAYLLSIEEDQVQALPPEVYLRAYLNQYAQALHLNADSVTRGYLQHYQRLKDQKPRP
jgi:curved DNA-binding protein CbpA